MELSPRTPAFLSAKSIPCHGCGPLHDLTKLVSGDNHPNIKEAVLDRTEVIAFIDQLVVQISCLCPAERGRVSQAADTCRIQCASALISHLTSQSHLLPVRLLHSPPLILNAPLGKVVACFHALLVTYKCTRLCTLARTWRR